MISSLDFDTRLFGYPVGAVDWEADCKETDFLRAVKDFKLVYVFSEVPLSFANPQFLPVDVKVLFEKELNFSQAVDGVQVFSQENPVSLSQQEKEALRFLALESGVYSRFKTDPRLVNEKFEKLYELWIDQALTKNELIIGTHLEGMITYRIQEKTGKIGLFAVQPNHRQKGWGKKLVSAAEHYLGEKGIKKLQIPTQESNQSAMGLYQKIGYQVVRKTYIYHYWKD
ncbi:GNAT family N-acetyltransferase [Algoriphagus sp.]|uniref:GNAT family N-acetyltransferase n=1 Tax=Algoriphagus sp. TaxID=1872435 RepID=UPI0026088A40|nr:GNAT family N-acetyltransferase [Algoriphagus sp.]